MSSFSGFFSLFTNLNDWLWDFLNWLCSATGFIKGVHPTVGFSSFFVLVLNRGLLILPFLTQINQKGRLCQSENISLAFCHLSDQSQLWTSGNLCLFSFMKLFNLHQENYEWIGIFTSSHKIPTVTTSGLHAKQSVSQFSLHYLLVEEQFLSDKL